jgi:hypothetical protein
MVPPVAPAAVPPEGDEVVPTVAALPDVAASLAHATSAPAPIALSEAVRRKERRVVGIESRKPVSSGRGVSFGMVSAEVGVEWTTKCLAVRQAPLSGGRPNLLPNFRTGA